MPSITTIHESLPYIDTEPTADERAAAEALISAERALVPDDPHHALLPTTIDPQYSPAIRAELDRVAASQPLSAIDLSRYEAQEPLSESDLAGLSPAEAVAKLESTLARAGASATYLAARRTHLALLDAHGRNAWLIGNWQLEERLKALERELAESKRQIDVLTVQRRKAQEEAGPEIKYLEEAWKNGVGRALETEVAAEELRQQVLESRRETTA